MEDAKAKIIGISPPTRPYLTGRYLFEQQLYAKGN